MEQLIGRAKFSAKCVKNEIHNILTTLRLTRPTHMSSPQAKFHMNSLKAFQQLFEELTYMHELHEFDIVAYVNPFLEVIQSDATSGELTAVALEAVDKFVSFGLVHPESPKSMEAINTVAWGVIHCRFLSNGWASDEVVLLKMVGLLLDCLRCSAGPYLSDFCVWHMVRKCFQVSRQPNASHLLRSSAEGMLQQMVLTIFGTQKERSQRVRVESVEADADARRTAESQGPKLQVYKPYGFRAMHFVLRFLSFLLAYGVLGRVIGGGDPRSRAMCSASWQSEYSTRCTDEIVERVAEVERST
ncbi:Golgi-specific brefeldin A-resistance guanine nucleotide exchange factor 1 (BFA-resistant GEF 1) [Durusdinium trenchii]|uniref:Golgi-specific brefeldin A-resistance guanine nucleotide exchange factor 1 (BFA-resistant GEF 1) n=1 Tax=Durusdinium trenchii TaxID=1381693 RepID=A0ABP0HGM9_9DINO